MKKLLALILAALMVFSLAACDKSVEEDPDAPVTKSAEEGEVSSETETTEAPRPLLSEDDYREYGVDELNSAPVLMYHRIYKMKDADTEYTGGNVDADGYNRTSESFERDLERYYQDGYRMIRLSDYLDGYIDTELGKTPLMLTFDDGMNNFEISGRDAEGNIIPDPECAVGILEKFKAKYPDYNVTATFFLNKELFQDKENNAEIIQWMVDHGYDIGNHTMNHPMLSSCSAQEINDEVGGVYEKLESIIPGRYVNIVALPYGDPPNVKDDSKYDKLFNCEFNGKKYNTKATLLCSWTREDSPFIKTFDNTYVKRIRAYDHDGTDFDIEMNFAQLNEGRRYISDGNPDTIVIRKEDKDYLGETYGKTVIEY